MKTENQFSLFSRVPESNLQFSLHQKWTRGFPDSSVDKEFTCNAGDPGSIPGSGRSTGEGIGHPFQYSWASLVAQLVKNPPAIQETCVRSLGWEDPLEKGKATYSSILAWRNPWTVHEVAKSPTWLSDEVEKILKSKKVVYLKQEVANPHLNMNIKKESTGPRWLFGKVSHAFTSFTNADEPSADMLYTCSSSCPVHVTHLSQLSAPSHVSCKNLLVFM